MEFRRLVLINLFICLFVGGISFISWHFDQRSIIASSIEIARSKGQALYELFQAVRGWNDKHGLYVYNSSPDHLEDDPAITPQILTRSSGESFTRLNSAHLTKEIAKQFTAGKTQVLFTSLILTNPDNAPDEWTQKALKGFEENPSPVVDLYADQFRYLAPLHIEFECLECHKHQGYKLGDIRGGLGFVFPQQEINKIIHPQLEINSEEHVVWGAATAGLLMITHTGYFLFRRRLATEVAQNEQLSQMVNMDTLTGVYSRHALFEKLAELMARSERHQIPLSLVMYDLDHFKAINDNYGHLMGDEVLQAVSDLVSSQLREIDFVGRYGGEEFLVILSDTKLESAKPVAERLRSSIENADIVTPSGGRVSVTISAGLAEMDLEKEQSATELIERADIALYEAKNGGRNCIKVWQG